MPYKNNNIHKRGKVKFLKTIKRNYNLAEVVKTFTNPNATMKAAAVLPEIYFI